MLKRLLCLLPGLALLAMPALAQDLETDWIKPVEGYEETAMGARLRNIETEDGETRVTIDIPKSSLKNAENIEEVVVMGKRPDQPEEQIQVEHEWASDYDNDYYGLVLHLGSNGDIPLRLYLKGQEAPGRP